MKNYSRYLITSALPYANGPVHIGHLAGVYIPSDTWVRYLRLRGREVIHVCGSDEHGVPIMIKALKEGVSPQTIVDKYHTIIKKAFEDFGITFDIYSRTSTQIHHQTSSDFFKTLYEKGIFAEKENEQYYDPQAQQFLADRYITGTCPHCGNDKAYGDQCEKCGTSLNPTDLIGPKSTISGSKPELRASKHWYLPLDQYQQFLEKWILEENAHWKSNVYGQCKSWLSQGLQARAVSRDLDWGVPVPLDQAKGKVLYVWFDAPIGYISATRELTPEWEKYWKSDDTRLIHFIGKDNIVFHCIIFPVMLKAEGSYILPENVPANEFLNLEGDKISTSRNWAVWLHEYLEEFPGKQDVLRYVLTANMPETKDNDFTWKDFQARNNNELVAVLGNFVNRALMLTEKYFNGQVPPLTTRNDFDDETLAELAAAPTRIEENLENFRFRDALKEAMNIARLGNKYLADTEPWKLYKTEPEKVKTILNISLQITANLSTLLEPFLPFTCQKIRQMLNIEAIAWENTGLHTNLPAGHQLLKSFLLFDKIEDTDIERQILKLHLTRQEAQEAALDKVDEARASISFDDFQKIDIRTATILDAEKVPKTKKLLKLTLDTGLDTRTVVSGIAEFYEPKDIVGRQILVLVNLEPRELKGIESKGMVLLAEEPSGRLTFVSPETKISNGSVVK